VIRIKPVLDDQKKYLGTKLFVPVTDYDSKGKEGYYSSVTDEYEPHTIAWVGGSYKQWIFNRRVRTWGQAKPFGYHKEDCEICVRDKLIWATTKTPEDEILIEAT